MAKIKEIKLFQEDFGILAIDALRYCFGRETYMPSLVRDIIRPHLPELTDKDLSVMLNDCDFQERCCLYGNETIDKPGWLQWKQELKNERNRRAADDKNT